MNVLRELALDVTDRCPMTCLHCSANSTPYLDRFLPFDKAGQVIRDAVELGLEILSFTGGEPLLHPQLTQMIGLAHSLGVKDIRIFTSGLRFSLARAAPMDASVVESLASAGLSKILFNLQGPSPEIHEKITLTPGSFRAVMSDTELCKKHGLYVGFHFVPMKYNWDSLPELVHLARDRSVDEIGILMFVPQGRGAANGDRLQLEQKELLAFLALAGDLIKGDGKPKLRLGCPFNSLAALLPSWPEKRCPAGSDMCHVLIDGSVAPCSAFKYEAGFKGGNIQKQSLREIWNQAFDAFQEVRGRMKAEYDCTAQKLLSTRTGNQPVTIQERP